MIKVRPGIKLGFAVLELVGQNYQERQEIFELVQQAYRRRSALVHGGGKKRKDDITPKELAEKSLRT